MNARVAEKAFLIGPRKSMVAIVAEAGGSGPGDRPAVVILNAGIIHRVGPSRMNVLLARDLAQAGYTALRFDLSGLGDSETRPDGLAPLEASLADVREALDWLESARQARRVVLVGLCSGANHALLYGGSDPRVVGLVLLDPLTPKTTGYYVRHFIPRLFRPNVWYRVLRGRHPLVKRLAGRVAGRDEGSRPPRVDLRSREAREVLERAYRAALDAGVRLLTVFTGALEDQLNYPEQVLDAFPGVSFRDRMRLEYFQETEHTFTLEADRARLSALVVEWLGSTPFAGRASPGAASD